jgi:para-nitrobenzyl esterase
MAKVCVLLSLGILTVFTAVVMQAASTPEAKIDTGKLRGKADGNISVFLGIPYAAPPVGNLRWKAPAPPAKWSGARDATQFGSRCMQGAIYSDMVFRDPGINEDCLYLNVWTSAKKGAKLPVMVWIYGGGFVAGATSEPRQEGTNLAKHGVVVVSMNYRLGVFGFLVHPDLIAESGRNSAGNYGLLDQVAALEWVKRNISAFGGDPNNVTIFGESAGSFSVSALMASPRTKGLFHKAIGESGAAFSTTGLRFEPAATVAPRHAKFAEESLAAKTIAEARAVPAQKVLEAAMDASKGGTFRFGPDVDGYFLPEPVPAIFAAGKQNDVPLLAGWNHDEAEFTVEKDKSPVASLKEYATKHFGDKADEFLRLYPGDTDEQTLRSLRDAAGDQFIAFSTWRWLEAQRKTGKSHTFRYRFDQSHPADPKRPSDAGAYHSAEIEYVFGQLDPENWISWRPEDRNLTEAMQTYWSNFAKAGDPNGPPSLSGSASTLPHWPVYDGDSGYPVLHLDAQIKAEKDSLRDRYLFLEAQAQAKQAK